MQVFISRNGEQIGDWTETEVRHFYEAGQLLPTDHYWREGMPEWQLLESLMAQPAPALSVPLASPPAAKPVKRQKAAKQQKAVKRRKESSRSESSPLGIIVPLVLAVVASIAIGPMSQEDSAAGMAGAYCGSAFVFAGTAFLVTLVVPRARRLASRCIIIVILSLMALAGKINQNQARDKTNAEMQAFAEQQRQDAAKQLAEKGYIEPDPQKTEAELAKIRDASSGESGADKIMTDTGLEVTEQLMAHQKACADAERPALALGLGPEKITSPDDLEERRMALLACQSPIQDTVKFLQNIDTTTRDLFVSKGLAAHDIDEYLKGFHHSGHVEALTTYWQLEGAIVTDQLANLDLLKANWGKWRMDNNSLLFDDDQTATAYNTTLKKIQDEAAQQRDAQKQAIAAPTPQ
jgi:hypothetical protein